MIPLDNFSFVVIDKSWNFVHEVTLRNARSFVAEDVYNDAGTWKLVLPISDTTSIKAFQKPGNSVIFAGPNLLCWSGPILEWTVVNTAQEGRVFEVQGSMEQFRLEKPVTTRWQGDERKVMEPVGTQVEYMFSNAVNTSPKAFISAVLDNISVRGRANNNCPYLRGSSLSGTAVNTPTTYSLTQVGNFNYDSKVAEVTTPPAYYRKDIRYQSALGVISAICAKYKWQLILTAMPRQYQQEGGIRCWIRQCQDLTSVVNLRATSGDVISSRYGVKNPTKSGLWLVSEYPTRTTGYTWKFNDFDYGSLQEDVIFDNSMQSNALATQKMNIKLQEDSEFHPKGYGQFVLLGDQTKHGFGSTWFLGDKIRIEDETDPDNFIAIEAIATGAIYSLTPEAIAIGVRMGDDVTLDARSGISIGEVEVRNPYDGVLAPTVVTVYWSSIDSKAVNSFDLKAPGTNVTWAKMILHPNLVLPGTEAVTGAGTAYATISYLPTAGQEVQSSMNNGWPPALLEPRMVSTAARSDFVKNGNNWETEEVVSATPVSPSRGVVVVQDATLAYSNIQCSSPRRILSGQSLTLGLAKMSGQAALRGVVYGGASLPSISLSSPYFERWTPPISGSEATNGLPNGWTLTMQTDGVLNLISNGSSKWSLPTGGVGKVAGSYAEIGSDGNLVVYNPSGGVVAQTGTSGITDLIYELPNNCNMGGRGGLKSANGKYRMNIDGSPGVQARIYLMHVPSGTKYFEVTRPSSSATDWAGIRPYNGRLAFFNASGAELGSLGSVSNGLGVRLVLQDDGNLVLYDTNNAVRWSAGVTGPP